MTLIETRPDHGTPHHGKFGALLRVSTDKQDVANQEHAIKAFLNGGKHQVEWFREENMSTKTDWNKRDVLHNCLDYCRKNKATLIVYSLSRLSRTVWETYRFFEQEITNGKIKLVVVDNPILDHNNISIMAAMAEMERNQIRVRTKAALARIKDEIAQKGSYVTKEGKTITKLGVHKNLDKAAKLGNLSNQRKAQERAERVIPIILQLKNRGLSLRAIARELNRMGIESPAKMMKPDISKRTEWYATSVRNFLMRK